MSTINKHPIVTHIDLVLETLTLLKISDDLSLPSVRNKNAKKKAIYRSSIINLSASWESFIVGATEQALLFITHKKQTTDKVPTNILLRVSQRLIEEKNTKEIWRISGDGWKAELKTNFDLLEAKFNTARPRQIDNFVVDSIGLKNLSLNWKWKGQSAQQSINKLNDFMDLRGQIAHKLITEKDIHMSLIFGYLNFFYKLTVLSCNAIRDHVFEVTGEYPWDKATFMTV